MLESCRRPELVCEITLQPVRRHGVDAAILFSDIVVPLAASVSTSTSCPGSGRWWRKPVRVPRRASRLLVPDATVAYVAEAVQLLSRELGATPLIEFAGPRSPWRPTWSRTDRVKYHEHTKALMYGDPDVWHALCARLAQVT